MKPLPYLIKNYVPPATTIVGRDFQGQAANISLLKHKSGHWSGPWNKAWNGFSMVFWGSLRPEDIFTCKTCHCSQRLMLDKATWCDDICPTGWWATICRGFESSGQLWKLLEQANQLANPMLQKRHQSHHSLGKCYPPVIKQDLLEN